MKMKVDFGIFIFILFFFCVVLSVADDDDDDEKGVKRNRCPFIRYTLVNGRVKIRSRGRVAKFVCNPGYQLVGKRFANCVGRNWNNPIPVCVAPGCANMDEPSNGKVTEKFSGALLDYECHPGYALYGSHTIYCNGFRWNDTVPVCEVALTHPQTFCDFEDPDLCGWTDDPNHDFNWKRHQYGTPSGHVGTGPSYDHSFGKGKAGFYMYEEASSPRKENDTSRLFSPVYPPHYSPGCFVFWYHMYGATMGSIRIYIKPESYVFGELTPSWEKYGDQGNQWLRGNVSVPTITENFQVVVEGIRGSSYVGDSAIDDVHLLQTNCSNIDAYNVSDTEAGAPDSCRGRCMERNETAICGCTDECFPDSCCRDYEKICFAGNDSYTWNIETEGILSTEQSITRYGTTEPLPTTLSGVTTSPRVAITSPSLQSSSGPGRNTVQTSSSSIFSSIPATSSLLPVATISPVHPASPQTSAKIPSSVPTIISSQPSPSSRLNPEVSTRKTIISTTSTKRVKQVEKTSHLPSTTETVSKTSSSTQTITSTIKTIPTVPVFLNTTTTKATLPPRPLPRLTTTKATTSTQTSPSTTPRPTAKPSTRIAIKITKTAGPKLNTTSTIQSYPVTKAASTPIQNYPSSLKTALTITSTPTATKTTKPAITNTITRRTSTVSTPTIAETTKMAASSIPMPVTMQPVSTFFLSSTPAPNTTELKRLSTKAISSTPLPPVAVTDTTTKRVQITSSWITHRLTTNTPPKTSSVSSSTLPMPSSPPPPPPSTTSSLSTTTKRISSTSATSRVFQTTVMMTTRSTLPPRTTEKPTTQSASPKTTKPPSPPPRTAKPTSPPPPRTAKPTSPPPLRTAKPTSPPPPRTAKPTSSPPPRTAKPTSLPPPPRTAKPTSPPPPRTTKKPSPPPPPPRRTEKPTSTPSPRLTIIPVTKRIPTLKNITSKNAETATNSTKKVLDNSVSASRSKSNANLIAGISVTILLLVCLVGGVGYIFWRQKRQRKLSDDSEMRFLPENEAVEFSEVSSFTDCLMEDT